MAVFRRAMQWAKDTWVEVGREGALGGAWIDRDLRAAHDAPAADAYNARIVADLEQRLVTEKGSKASKRLLKNIQILRESGEAAQARRLVVESAVAPARAASERRIAEEEAAIMRSGGYAEGRSPEDVRRHAEEGRACRDVILRQAGSEGPRDDSISAVARDLIYDLFHKPPVADCSGLQERTVG